MMVFFMTVVHAEKKRSSPIERRLDTVQMEFVPWLSEVKPIQYYFAIALFLPASN